MNKVIVTGATKLETFADTRSMIRSAKAEGHNLVVSDGYHTFDELYDHRITLYIALCRGYVNANGNSDCHGVPLVWRSKLHHDGKGYDGWFTLGIGTKNGKQISYHLPMERWDEVDFAQTHDKAPYEFDGHSSADVLERLKAL